MNDLYCRSHLPPLVPGSAAAATIAGKSLFFLGPGLHDFDIAALDHSIVKLCNGLPGCRLIAHLDESKPSGSTRSLVIDYPGGSDLSVRFKKTFQVLILNIETEVGNINIHSVY